MIIWHASSIRQLKNNYYRMNKQNTTTKHSGFAIAIAWPETYCKQAGYFPDNILNFMGIAKHHYYKVGHAALVLVNAENG